MEINPQILQILENNNSEFIAVTKYFEAEDTNKILEQIKNHPNFMGLGENRIKDVLAKKIPRKFCHFIGNIQSRNIPEIAKNCEFIHSLCDLKHSEIFAKQNGLNQFFVQINISREKNKSGILPENLESFLNKLPKNLEIIGISAIGRSVFSESEKIREFEDLKKLRQKFQKNWKISAGTSVDFEIALSQNIDIIRLGRKLIN